MKKWVLGVAILLVVSLGVFGGDLWSYMRTGTAWVTQSVKSQIPVEFELQRARQLVEELIPDIQANMHVIATEEVEVQHLQTEIAGSEKRMAVQKRQMLALRGDLDGGGATFCYGRRQYTRDQLKIDLVRRLDTYRQAETTLRSKRQLLEARQRSLAAAERKLEEMHDARRRLEVELENMSARMKMVQAAEATSKLALDGSKLSQAKRSMMALKKRLDVAQKMIEREGYLTEGVPVDEAPARDISAEIDTYFGRGAADRRAAAL